MTSQQHSSFVKLSAAFYFGAASFLVQFVNKVPLLRHPLVTVSHFSCLGPVYNLSLSFSSHGCSDATLFYSACVLYRLPTEVRDENGKACSAFSRC